MIKKENKIGGWGNFPTVDALVLYPTAVEELCNNWDKLSYFKLAKGMLRSYGDAALLENGTLVNMLPLNQIISFEDGILCCEAGCTLDKILKFVVPQGWFLPVTPGTKWVTIGGAIASDVHGKNHHFCGSISNFVLSFDLLTANGEVLHCSRNQYKNIFWATLAGFGLTGIVLNVTLRLEKIPSSYIQQVSYKVQNFKEAFYLFTQKEAEYPFSVAWLDCLAKGEHLGRSLLLFGNWADPTQIAEHKRFKIHTNRHLWLPKNFPSFLLGKSGIKTFNMLYYQRQQKAMKSQLLHYNSYFYPLDGIENWNRMYGKKGFVQYQFVLPQESALAGMQAILQKISDKGWGSFLVVLKKFGEADAPLLSFAKRGYTLALDFKMQRGLIPFLRQLDEMVLAYNGRVYLAKDATLLPDTAAKMYPNLDKWRQVKDEIDPHHQFQSALSKRLKLF